MKKMADKKELEFMKMMKEKGGFASDLEDFDMDRFRNSNVKENMGGLVPETSDMSGEKAERMMKEAGMAVHEGSNPRLNALKKLAGKGMKAAGVVAAPLIGLGTALSSGDASAAIPLLGASESAGMSSEDENEMIAERKAEMEYQKSQAARDRAAALAKLSKLQR